MALRLRWRAFMFLLKTHTPNTQRGNLRCCLGTGARDVALGSGDDEDDQDDHLDRGGDVAVAQLPGGPAVLHLDVLAQTAEEGLIVSIASGLGYSDDHPREGCKKCPFYRPNPLLRGGAAPCVRIGGWNDNFVVDTLLHILRQCPMEINSICHTRILN